MTKIEWTRGDDGSPGMTWNPTTGCDRVSPGCDNCYALTMAKRLKGMGSAKYQRDGDPRTSGPGFGITEHLSSLDAPLSWRKPRKVFVNSMSDLFHDGVSDEFIARVWAVMAATPQHTYQILTKRHGRMRSFLQDRCRCASGHGDGVHLKSKIEWASTPHNPDYVPGLKPGIYHHMTWPLQNVHLGVSVEDQKRGVLRIPALLDTPAAVRFLSCEPLLGPLDLDAADRDTLCDGGIDWVIVGGESGPGARELDVEWVRSIVEQCAHARVPVFVKQLGSVWARDHGGGKGGDPDRWPADLRVREFPAVAA